MAKSVKQPMQEVALTRKQQKEIDQAVARVRRNDGITSAQDTIPYEVMWPDGLCRLNDGRYSKSILFQDINYQIASEEDQKAAFRRLKSFYNFYDHSVGIQLTLLQHVADHKSWVSNLMLDGLDEEVTEIGREYASILKEKLSYGNNGLEETKILTFTISAGNEKDARTKFGRIELDTLNQLKLMGVSASVMNGKARLNVMHDILHPFGSHMDFDWKYLPASGLSTKDFIVPSSFTFGNKKRFYMGDTVCQMSYLQIICSELNDRILSNFMETEEGILLNMHIECIDSAKALKMIKRKMSDLDAMKIQEQKKASRGGYDRDIIPAELGVFGDDVKNLFHILTSQNEKMFLLTFLVMNFAKNKKALKNAVARAAGVAESANCKLVCLDYQQEDGMISSLPLGMNKIKIQRGLNTGSLSIFVPFMTQELFQEGEAVYYGLNALSGNMIMADRKTLMNPNGLILGSSGGGKSFSAKREIVNVFFATKDDIRILDPEAEYGPLVKALHGQIIKISPNSGHYVNPMDINLDYSDEDSPLALKSDFILSFCEIIAGGRHGLGPIEKSVIDRAVHQVYQKYFELPSPENMPILSDLYHAILEQPEPEAARIASALELYVIGSQNIFNHRTNVDIHNRLVSFDIKELGKQLKLLGMLVIQDQIWNLVNLNQSQGKATRYYVDEFHLLLKGEIASWSVEIWKRFRKWGGIPTGITQNIQDLFGSKEIESIFENSDFIYLLSQGPKDRDLLAEMLHISNEQLGYVTSSKIGEGLIFFGNTVLPFVDHFPKDTRLYQIFSTKPSDKKILLQQKPEKNGSTETDGRRSRTETREQLEAESRGISRPEKTPSKFSDYVKEGKLLVEEPEMAPELAELFGEENLVVSDDRKEQSGPEDSSRRATYHSRPLKRVSLEEWFRQDPVGFEEPPDDDLVIRTDEMKTEDPFFAKTDDPEPDSQPVIQQTHNNPEPETDDDEFSDFIFQNLDFS